MESTKKVEYIINCKESNVKIDFVEANKNMRSLIINLKTEEIFELNNTKKKYRRINPSTFNYAQKKFALETKNSSTSVIENYKVSNLKILFGENKKKTIDCLVSSDKKFETLQAVLKYLNINSNFFQYIHRVAITENVFIFSAKAYNSNGYNISKMYLSDIEEVPLADSIFSIPPEYKAWF